MTKNTKSNKKSNMKKLVPAAGMLAVSAVMLSTSTYAWFTMNKEVEVTGLQMSATASNALELSMGARGTDLSKLDTITSPTDAGMGKTIVAQPADKDVSWTKAEVIGSYYKSVGKLMPASSINAANLFYTTDATAGGRIANTFVGDPDAAAFPLNDSNTYSKAGTLTAVTDATGAGYYIDVPVWLRTTKLKPGETTSASLYCAIQISRRNDDGTKAAYSADLDQLYKAVRVAFIPAAQATDNTALTLPTAATTGTTIFGISDTTYGKTGTPTADGPAVAKVTPEGGDRKSEGVIADMTYAVNSASDSGIMKTGKDNFNYLSCALATSMPLAASADAYGEQAFIVRVWLEGEDQNCWDMTSNQNWNIDFAFSLEEFQNYDATSGATNDNVPSFAK